MDDSTSLVNQLLIAMPGMQDPNFSSTVTLICEHNEDGALGIILNRPLSLNMGGLFRQLGIETDNPIIAKDPVLMGGPVGPERGFVLHDGGDDFESTLKVSDDIQLTLSRDVIDALAEGTGPERSVVALGYAGWQAGQLEEEIMENSWLNVPASLEIIFETPFAQRWTAAAESLGIDISRIAPDAGRA
ncbi:MAG: YqgE/AlgH family protein [Woeseiaceae bacterium]|nr:YqgE/AlgH family protein [Woeseiaceae bacterium]